MRVKINLLQGTQLTKKLSQSLRTLFFLGIFDFTVISGFGRALLWHSEVVLLATLSAGSGLVLECTWSLEKAQRGKCS